MQLRTLKFPDSAGQWLVYRRRSNVPGFYAYNLFDPPRVMPVQVRDGRFCLVREERPGDRCMSDRCLYEEDCKDTYVFVGPLPETVKLPQRGPHARATEDEWHIEGLYDAVTGFETVTVESSRSEARATLRCYRDNEPGVAFRIKKCRVPKSK